MKVGVFLTSDHDRIVMDTLFGSIRASLGIKLDISYLEINESLVDDSINYHLVVFDIGNNQSYLIDMVKRFERSMQVLVLISNDPNGYQDGFRLKANRYFVRPINVNELKVELMDLIKAMNREIHSLIVEDQWVDKRDILYLESENRGIRIVLKDREQVDKMSFSNWVEMIDDDRFVICHRGIFVNLMYVKEIEQDTIVLTNGKILPLSRRSRRVVLEQYHHYLKHYSM